MTDMYICVDVQDRNRLVHVYSTDEDCTVSATFIRDPEWREHRSDRVVANPFESACAYAAYMAKSIGCDWGSN